MSKISIYFVLFLFWLKCRPGNWFDKHQPISAFCKSSLDHVQLPYLRATHKFDFFILFLSIWMDILTLICACGALTRTLSICLDAMTGGMTRRIFLGLNSPENEPWPDVIGFSIIFILSVMFMLGLEVIIRHYYLNDSFRFQWADKLNFCFFIFHSEFKDLLWHFTNQSLWCHRNITSNNDYTWQS